MASVALIGPDGAGKTTLCRMLEQSSLLRFKYVYMGTNVSAYNVMLPTTRLLARLRPRTHTPAGEPPRHAVPPRGPAALLWYLRAVLRLVHRLSEEWYRQFVSWGHELRGHTVLYDRHFTFDFAVPIGPAPLTTRIHGWLLEHCYPRPTLVIYLDAPAELLFARKGEWTPETLRAKGAVQWARAQRSRAYTRVDASQPVEKVYADVAAHITAFFECDGGQAPVPSGVR